MLARRVLAESTVVPVRRAIASGYICAQRVLAEPKVVCDVIRLRDVISVYTFAVCYGCVALCVGLDVQSRVVPLPGLWSC